MTCYILSHELNILYTLFYLTASKSDALHRNYSHLTHKENMFCFAPKATQLLNEHRFQHKSESQYVFLNTMLNKFSLIQKIVTAP